MAVCKRCGHLNEYGATFCSNCGTYLDRWSNENISLSETERNAITFIIALIGILVGAGAGKIVFSSYQKPPFDMIAGGLIGFLFSIMPAFGAPSFYEMTMRSGVPILKSSLLIALLISVVSALYTPILAIFSIVFIISPVLYDFFRDLVSSGVPSRIPWHERKLGVRVLEIVLEAAMSAVIGLVIVFLLTGHL